MSASTENRPETISVGMPVYNGARHLEAAIQSVLRQSHGDFKLYISDNASTDQTEEICRDFAGQDSRIVYRRNETNVGAARNYNLLYDLAKGPYFRWFNADDISTPDLHEKCLRVLEANPDAVLCCGQTQLIDDTGKVTDSYRENLDLRQERSDERYRQFCKVAGMTNAIYGLMRSPAVGSTALMGNGSYMDADTMFMAELSLYGKFIVIDEPLFFRRMHREAYSWVRQDAERDRQFWTAGSRRFVLPHWKRLFAQFSAVSRAPIGTAAKLRLGRHLVRQMIWDRAVLWGDVRHFARNRATGARRTSAV
jgi:glycosyltransferase involved in cell wall biosynthesis